MKFTSRTTQVLNNYATINPSLIFKKGDTIMTMSPNKTVLSKAKLDQEFESEFAIFDLNRFLSALSLFKEPEIEATSKQIKIISGGQEIKYTCADPSVINIKLPEKQVRLPKPDAAFSLSLEAFNSVNKAAGVLALPEIAVVGDGQKLFLKAINTKNMSGDNYEVEIGTSQKEFIAVFKKEYLKIIPGNYEVSISSQGISLFSGEFIDYWIAIDAATSKFE